LEQVEGVNILMRRMSPLADCLIICTQDTMHVEPAIMAIRQGYKHILMEKPIDPDIEESYRLLKAAKENNVNIQICHSLRYTPYFRKMKELLDNKRIGDIVNIGALWAMCISLRQQRS
jgi:predicted dehydrogenase